jgi:hypothetical protein
MDAGGRVPTVGALRRRMEQLPRDAEDAEKTTNIHDNLQDNKNGIFTAKDAKKSKDPFQ